MNNDCFLRTGASSATVGCRLYSGCVNAAVNEASNMLRARDDDGPGVLKPMLVRFAQRFPISASPELAILFRRCRFLVHEAVIGHLLLVLGPILGSNVGVCLCPTQALVLLASFGCISSSSINQFNVSWIQSTRLE